MYRSPFSYFIELLIHVLFWLGVYYALTALTASSFQLIVRHSDGSTQRMDGRMLFPYGWIVLIFLMLLFYSNSFWLLNKMIRYPGTFRRGGVITAALLLFVLDYLVIRWLVANSPPPSATLSVAPFSVLDWWGLQPIMALIFSLVLGIALAYFFIGEWIRQELLRSQAQALHLSTEVRFLRSQINPHFLFNTLNNLFSMAQQKENHELAEGIAKLAGLMRYMLYDSNTQWVSLASEVAYLTDCIALNKLRYADREALAHFSHPEPSVMASVQVAPMLFVPFVENAFKHGVLIGQTSPIFITIGVEGDRLCFRCENHDHSAVNRLAEKGGFGLDNVRRRLALLYPDRYELQVYQEDKKYIVNLQLDRV